MGEEAAATDLDELHARPLPLKTVASRRWRHPSETPRFRWATRADALYPSMRDGFAEAIISMMTHLGHRAGDTMYVELPQLGTQVSVFDDVPAGLLRR
jgi:hypothetical protein